MECNRVFWCYRPRLVRVASDSAVPGRCGGSVARGFRRLCRGIGVAAIVWSELTGQSAVAQQLRDQNRDQRLDLSREQIVPSDLPSTTIDPQRARGDFTLVLSAPFTFNSNVPQSGSDRASDVRTTPEAELIWERQFADFRLTADLDVLFDRYRHQTDFDTDSLFAEFRVDAGSAKSNRWTPFVSYATTLDFDPVFSSRVLSLNDLAAGVSNAWYFAPDGTIIPRSEADQPGTIGLRFSATAGYRFADPEFDESGFARFKFRASYLLTPDVVVLLDPTLTIRRYVDDGTGTRTDMLASARLALAWTPEWLDGMEFQITGQLARNTSSKASFSYTQWSIGPGIAFVQLF